MLFSTVFSILALAAASVNAHGYVGAITANGKRYIGGVPGETNPKSPIRSISTIDPFKSTTDKGIQCGRNSKPGALIAPVNAGSALDLEWVAHPGQKWPHDMGSLITYMAKVPAGKTAANVDPGTLDFFKIQQTGQTAKGSSKWVLASLMKVGAKYTVQIPKGLANGDYIMRHEIIALHLADSKGGAEFYTSCFQLNVAAGTGNANTKITPTTKFPGAYTATDAGIWTKKIFDGGFNYVFPGPAIAKISGSAANAGAGIVNATVSLPVSASSSAATSKPTGKHCKRQWSSRHGAVAAPAS